jgi:hypothetical protein
MKVVTLYAVSQESFDEGFGKQVGVFIETYSTNDEREFFCFGQEVELEMIHDAFRRIREVMENTKGSWTKQFEQFEKKTYNKKGLYYFHNDAEQCGVTFFECTPERYESMAARYQLKRIHKNVGTVKALAEDGYDAYVLNELWDTFKAHSTDEEFEEMKLFLLTSPHNQFRELADG